MKDRPVSPLSFQPQKVPLLDISRDNAELRDEMLSAMGSVLDSGRFLHGPEVSKLEQQVAAWAGTQHAVGCASGSDALLLALMAADIGPGDEVIVPSFTFFATASAVYRLGARVVFAEIEPATFNIDPAQMASLITPRTKAVIPVHLYGQCAAMEEICHLAKQHNLLVIEDAAQAIGAQLDGRAAGSWGHVGCFSFYPTKNLGGCGDGGMLTTSDAKYAERLRLFAAHGMNPRYFHSVVGINSRLDSVQAAALCVKLRYLMAWTEQRRQNAQVYQELFTKSRLDQVVTIPTESDRAYHVWNQFTIRVHDGRRDALRKHLEGCGVGSEIYYPHPLHLQECFRELGYGAGSLPETERAAREVLSLPIFPGLTAEEQRVVVGQIGNFFAKRQSAAA